MLSLLLGAHPEPISPSAMTRAGNYFGISASTIRAALSRAVAAGEVERSHAEYVLGDPLVERQRYQMEAIDDAETEWDGDWELAVVSVTGRSGAQRAALRDTMRAHRLAELREGVWTRPANLRRPSEYAADRVLTTFRAVPDGDSVDLAASLWDLGAWSEGGRRLRARLEATTEPAARLAVAAQLVRHLATDPLLPAPLLPVDWPAAELRGAYAAYEAELRRLALG